MASWSTLCQGTSFVSITVCTSLTVPNRFIVLVIILFIYIRLHIFLRHRRRSVQKSLHDTVSLETESGQLPVLGRFQTDELGEKSPRLSAISDVAAPSSWGSQVTVCPQPRTPPTSTEPIHENMADFINRKARMLVLLFPLSVGRTIFHFMFQTNKHLSFTRSIPR